MFLITNIERYLEDRKIVYSISCLREQEGYIEYIFMMKIWDFLTLDQVSNGSINEAE